MKKFGLFILLFMITVLLLINCEKENVYESPESQIIETKLKINNVKLSDIPDINNYLSTKVDGNMFKSTEINGAIFEDDILEVIDTINRANYSFKFIYPDTPIGTFYNLIVGKSEEGEFMTPYVLKYVCDDSFLEEFIENDFNIEFFNGIVNLHKYTDFFDLGSVYKSNSPTNCPTVHDVNGDPTPCEQIETNGGGTSNGSGTSNGGSSTGGSSSSTGGGETSCRFAVRRVFYRCDSFYGPANNDYDICSRSVATWTCPSAKSNNLTKSSGDCEDCPKPSGTVGVGTSSKAVQKTNYYLDGILTQEHLNFLNKNTDIASEINSFLLANRNTDASFSKEVKNLAIDFLDITGELPKAKFKRFLELSDLIEKNPFVLLENCVQENGLAIANYQQLYDHTLPASCTDKLNALGDNFKDQPLNTGNAAVANVDYYGVEITTNPDFNLDGNPDTDAEVFNAYRENFTSWASGSKDDFQFSCNIPLDADNKADVSWTFSPYFSSDATIWNSTNPLTAIIEIDANADVTLGLGNFISDDGAIMISAFTSQYWIGSTVATLQTGTQPFSGNRQWGFRTNQNNNLELYTRAVDVARISAIVNLDRFSSEECKEDTYYNIGEATWSNLQEQIKKWVNVNGGQATLIPKTAIRLDKTKLKAQLESNETIDQINCN